jgi:hypothetical protein
MDEIVLSTSIYRNLATSAPKTHLRSMDGKMLSTSSFKSTTAVSEPLELKESIKVLHYFVEPGLTHYTRSKTN